MSNTKRNTPVRFHWNQTEKVHEPTMPNFQKPRLKQENVMLEKAKDELEEFGFFSRNRDCIKSKRKWKNDDNRCSATYEQFPKILRQWKQNK